MSTLDKQLLNAAIRSAAEAKAGTVGSHEDLSAALAQFAAAKEGLASREAELRATLRADIFGEPSSKSPVSDAVTPDVHLTVDDVEPIIPSSPDAAELHSRANSGSPFLVATEPIVSVDPDMVDNLVPKPMRQAQNRVNRNRAKNAAVVLPIADPAPAEPDPAPAALTPTIADPAPAVPVIEVKPQPTPEEAFKNFFVSSNDLVDLYANIEFCGQPGNGEAFFSGTFMIDGKPANGVELSHVLEDLSERVLSGDIDLKDAAAKAPAEYGIRDKFVALVNEKIADNLSNAKVTNATSMKSPDTAPPVIPPMPDASVDASLVNPAEPLIATAEPTMYQAPDATANMPKVEYTGHQNMPKPDFSSWEAAKNAAARAPEFTFNGQRYVNTGDNSYQMADDGSPKYGRPLPFPRGSAVVEKPISPVVAVSGEPRMNEDGTWSNVSENSPLPGKSPETPNPSDVKGENPRQLEDGTWMDGKEHESASKELGLEEREARMAAAEKLVEDARSLYAEKEYSSSSTWGTILRALPGMRGRARSDRQEAEIRDYRAAYEKALANLRTMQLEDIKQSGVEGKNLQEEMAGLLVESKFTEGETLWKARLETKHREEGKTLWGKIKNGLESMSKGYQKLHWSKKLVIGLLLGAGTAGSAYIGAIGATAGFVAARSMLGGAGGFATADGFLQSRYDAKRGKDADMEQRLMMATLLAETSEKDPAAQFEKLGKFLEDDIKNSDAKMLERKGKESANKLKALAFGGAMAGLTAFLGMKSVHAAEAAAQHTQQAVADEAAKKAAAAAVQHAGGSTLQSDMLIAQERVAEFGSGADQANAVANAVGDHANTAVEAGANAQEAAKNLYEQALTVPKGGSIEGAIIKQLATFDPSISHEQGVGIAHQMVLEKFQEMHDVGSVASLDDFNRVSENMHFNIAGDADGYFIKDVAESDLGTWTRHAAQATHEAVAQHTASHVEAVVAAPVAHVEAAAQVISPAQVIENHTSAAFNTMLLEGQQKTGLRTIDYFARQIVGGASTPGAGFDILTMNDNVPNMNQMLGLTVDSVLKHGTNASPEQMKHLGEFVTSAMKVFPGTGPTSGNFIGGETTASYLKRITMLMLHAQERGTEIKLDGFGVLQKGL